LLPALDLHHHGTFQDVNECFRIVPVDWIGTARRIFHEDHQSLLAWEFLKFPGKERSDFGFLRERADS